MSRLTQRAVGTFSDHKTTDIALHELKDHGFFMEQVSVIGLDIYHYPEFTGANTSDRLVNTGNLDTDETRGPFVDAGNLDTYKTREPSVNLDTDENKAKETARDGAIAGSTIGGFAGLLVGLGALAIPGVGPVMLAGAAATAIATAISGGVIGAAAGSLTGGLVGLGIPEDRAKIYDDRIAKGGYLVIVEGSEVDIKLAKSIFDKHDIHDWYIYDLSSQSVRSIV
ncbi:MAG: signal transduction histidine kinase (STHK), LytS [Gloeocapsa sp. DLM2.Bin57]|nr:MAG: signal transduction histidine kinase (STHK), LytS [Gloeocapsa sp. DLM2.Bin57]